MNGLTLPQPPTVRILACRRDARSSSVRARHGRFFGLGSGPAGGRVASARTAPNNAVGPGGRAGLTLVELLVAAVAVGILLVVLVQVGQYVRGQGLTRFTANLLGQVQAATSQYHDLHRRWPADRFDRQRVAPTAEHQPATEGVECLVLALAPLHPAAWEAAAFHRARVNGDGDSNANDRQALYEWVDGWGRPLLYYSGGGAGPDQAGRGLPPLAGYGEAAMRQLNDALSRRWIQKDRRPLIDSAGPDGAFNNSDDQRLDRDEQSRP